MNHGDEFTMCQRILYDGGHESFKVETMTADRTKIAQEEPCPDNLDACYYSVPFGSPKSKCKETWETRTPANLTIYPTLPNEIDAFRNVNFANYLILI